MTDVYELYKRIMKYDLKAIDEIETLDQAKEIIKMIMSGEMNRRIFSTLEHFSIDKFIVTGQDGNGGIFIGATGTKDFESDLKRAVKEIVNNKKLKDEDVRLLMNKRTCDLLSVFFITLPYFMKLFYYPVSIMESFEDGEIRVTNRNVLR